MSAELAEKDRRQQWFSEYRKNLAAGRTHADAREAAFNTIEKPIRPTWCDNP